MNKQQWETYRRHPGSFALHILVVLSAAITVGVLVVLVGYIPVSYTHLDVYKRQSINNAKE